MGNNEQGSAVRTIIQELSEKYLHELSSSKTHKGASRPTIGTLCLSSPVELVEAVGAAPVRLMTSTPEAELRGGRFLSSDSCSFCKSVLGSLDHGVMRVDAVLGSTTCDQMRRNLEIIAGDLHIPVFIFNSPHTSQNDFAREFAKKELLRLAEEISAWAGTTLEAERLTAVIVRRQELRRRLQALREAGERGFPRLKGGEFLALLRLFQLVSTEFFAEHLPQIEEIFEQLNTPYQKEPVRIAVLGSCLGEGDDLVVTLIEESGRAYVAYDLLCTGSLALYDDSALAQDPYEALLELHHDRILCPFRRPNDHLFQAACGEMKRKRLQGVVYKTLKFCHPWGFEARRFKDLLGLPFLHLDQDLSPSAAGQARTRIHAFLEQLSFKSKAPVCCQYKNNAS